MLIPCRTTTRPWASVIQRPAWPSGRAGFAIAAGAMAAAAASAVSSARRMRTTVQGGEGAGSTGAGRSKTSGSRFRQPRSELGGVGGQAEEQAAAELVDRRRDEHVLGGGVDVAQAALKRRGLIQRGAAAEAVGRGRDVRGGQRRV